MMKVMKIYVVAALLLGQTVVAHAQNSVSDYSDFKKMLNDKYGFDYSLDMSLLEQRTSPNGENNSVQAYLYPSFTWTTIDNQNGTGNLNFAYTIIRYGRHNGNDLAGNSGFVTPVNDYPDNENEFSELYYTYQPKGKWNWLTVGAGQFPIYNFDGTTYDENQQVNFLNDSLAQNGSASYAQAGVGVFAEITPNDEWTFAIGGQDGTNVDAPSIRVNHIDEKHYTTFGYAAYTPTLKNIGESEISVLVYNQPAVKEQPETTNGWSLNLSQNIGEKLALFARINGVSGSVESVRQSWVFGGVYNNPFNRHPLDQIGLAYAYNKIDEEAVGEPIEHKAEQVVEAYWSWGIGQMLIITPDVQLYITPALNQKSDYGFATSLRATVLF